MLGLSPQGRQEGVRQADSFSGLFLYFYLILCELVCPWDKLRVGGGWRRGGRNHCWWQLVPGSAALGAELQATSQRVGHRQKWFRACKSWGVLQAQRPLSAGVLSCPSCWKCFEQQSSSGPLALLVKRWMKVMKLWTVSKSYFASCQPNS